MAMLSTGQPTHQTSRSAHSPPHSIPMREEPLGSRDVNPLLPGPQEPGLRWGRVMIWCWAPMEVRKRFCEVTEHLGQPALCIWGCDSYSDLMKHNFRDRCTEILLGILSAPWLEMHGILTPFRLKSWLGGQSDLLLIGICRLNHQSSFPPPQWNSE